MALLGRAGFVGGVFVDTPTPGGIPIPWPAGTLAGDVAIVIGQNNGSTSIPSLSTSGWSETFNEGNRMFRKKLTGADLTATITYSGTLNTFLLLLVFRSYAGINVLSSQAAAVSGSTHNWTGVTKSSGCRGLVFVPFANIHSAGALTVTAPSMASLKTGAGGTYDSNSEVNAYFNLAPAEYTNSTTITVSGYDNSGQCGLVVFELV